jgi:small ligand-binding sensory domain FIST
VLLESLQQLGDRPAHLAMVFVSPHHRLDFEAMRGRLREALPEAVTLGCCADGVIGGGHELEGRPALSLWLAHLPGVEIEPYVLEFETSGTGEGTTGRFCGWPRPPREPLPSGAFAVLIGDPFTFPVDLFLRQADLDFPGVGILGGMASAGLAQGDSALFLQGRQLSRGAVGVLLSGEDLNVTPVVSQGCRPIGRHLVITMAEDNLIKELGGKPALRALAGLLRELPPAERELVQEGLHVGQVVNEAQTSFGRGDFLVRNVLGFDAGSGAIAVNDLVRRGQTIQFHVRDAAAASEDLRLLLEQHRQPPDGALMFSCSGRGQRLFQRPDHDVSTLQSVLGVTPTAGFFAAGEIGPVGGRNFLHGFSTAIALFGGGGE